jgi:uncharacterized protein involved in exopolysaccharide biosynthesis
MTLHQFLLALRGRLWIFLLLAGTTFAAVVVATLLMARTYEGVVSILADIKDEQMLNSPQQSPRMQLGYMQTQIDILQSQRVARKVVEDMKLDENPACRRRSRGAAATATSRTGSPGGLLADLKVDSSQSSVIVAKYSSDDPKFAADVANAFAKAYVDTVLQAAHRAHEGSRGVVRRPAEGPAQVLRGSPGAARGLREGARHHRHRRARGRRGGAAERALGPVAARRDLSYDAGARSGQARGGVDSAPDVLANPLVQSLKGDLLRAESKLQELSTRLGPNHPQYQQQASEVQALRQRVNFRDPARHRRRAELGRPELRAPLGAREGPRRAAQESGDAAPVAQPVAGADPRRGYRAESV